MTDRSPVQPTSVRITDVDIVSEFTDFVGAIGFYIFCGLLGVLPRAVGGPVLERFVSWAAAYDERRTR